MQSGEEVGGQQREMGWGEQQDALLQSHRVCSCVRTQAEAVRTEAAFAVERAEAAAAQARADAAMGEAMLQERLVQCQQDLEQAKVRSARGA